MLDAAGADLVGGEDLIQQVADQGASVLDGVKSCVATPDMMAKLSRVTGWHCLPLALLPGPNSGLRALQIARIIGPMGLMPNPKAGTLTTELAKTVAEVKKGRVEFRLAKDGWMIK